VSSIDDDAGGPTHAPTCSDGFIATEVCGGLDMCEYGNDENFACDDFQYCTSGSWFNAPQSSNDPTCASRAPGDGGCPVDRPTAGDSCSTVVNCSYPEGLCGCSDLGTDGGAVWGCESPEPGCSIPRPRVGSACTNEGQTCTYGACNLSEGLLPMTCDHFVWRIWDGPAPACP
jgi:hypothetical protein